MLNGFYSRMREKPISEGPVDKKKMPKFTVVMVILEVSKVYSQRRHRALACGQLASTRTAGGLEKDPDL